VFTVAGGRSDLFFKPIPMLISWNSSAGMMKVHYPELFSRHWVGQAHNAEQLIEILI